MLQDEICMQSLLGDSSAGVKVFGGTTVMASTSPDLGLAFLAEAPMEAHGALFVSCRLNCS